MSDPIDEARRLLERQDIDSWEIFREQADTFSAEVKDGRLDSSHHSRLSGMAVRAVKEGRLGFSFTSALDIPSVQRTVETAVSVAAFMPQDPDWSPPDAAALPDLSDALLDSGLVKTGQDRKIEIARLVEASARGHDRRVTTVRSAGYSEAVVTRSLVNSAGVNAGGQSGLAHSWVHLMAEEDGDQEQGYWLEQARSPLDIVPETVGKTAAQRALDSLGGRTIASAAMPVIVENTVAADLLQVIAGSFLGENHYKKKASPRIGTGLTVFSPSVTILDDGLDPRGAEAFSFDGEGTPSQKTVIVERGIVKSLLFDRYYAAKFGVASTGNCRRSGFDALPSSNVTNLVMLPGEHQLTGLFAVVGRGLLVTEVMGLHTADPISGDFSVGAAGFLIEGGERREPVKGIAIAGNLIDLLASVQMVADDFRFFGSTGAPSFLVESLAVSGT